MITEAKDIQATYEYHTGRLKVIEKGKIRIFKDVPEIDCDKLIDGLEGNPGSGYKHFIKFFSKYFDKEVGGEYDLAYKDYRKQKDEEEWDKEIEKTYKDQQDQEFEDEFGGY